MVDFQSKLSRESNLTLRWSQSAILITHLKDFGQKSVIDTFCYLLQFEEKQQINVFTVHQSFDSCYGNIGVESMWWRDFVKGNHSTLASLQPSGSRLILFTGTSVFFHSGFMFL